MRTLIDLAVEIDIDIHHPDIKTAFLNRILEENVSMDQPGGFKLEEQDRKVCKLRQYTDLIMLQVSRIKLYEEIGYKYSKF